MAMFFKICYYLSNSKKCIPANKKKKKSITVWRDHAVHWKKNGLEWWATGIEGKLIKQQAHYFRLEMVVV